MVEESTVPSKSLGIVLLLVAGATLAICLEAARAPKHEFAWQAAAFARSLIGLVILVPMAGS